MKYASIFLIFVKQNKFGFYALFLRQKSKDIT